MEVALRLLPRTAVVAAILLVVACGGRQPGFTRADEDAVRALEERYRTAWLANDSAAVMATLASDAVLMPGGEESLTGGAAIRAFW